MSFTISLLSIDFNWSLFWLSLHLFLIIWSGLILFFFFIFLLEYACAVSLYFTTHYNYSLGEKLLNLLSKWQSLIYCLLLIIFLFFIIVVPVNLFVFPLCHNINCLNVKYHQNGTDIYNQHFAGMVAEKKHEYSGLMTISLINFLMLIFSPCCFCCCLYYMCISLIGEKEIILYHVSEDYRKDFIRGEIRKKLEEIRIRRVFSV